MKADSDNIEPSSGDRNIESISTVSLLENGPEEGYDFIRARETSARERFTPQKFTFPSHRAFTCQIAIAIASFRQYSICLSYLKTPAIPPSPLIFRPTPHTHGLQIELKMSASAQPVSPSQLLRRFSTILSTDLSEGADLLKITYILVLRNLLKNFRRCGSKAYAFLRIVVPYIVLISGIYGATLDLKAPSTAFKAVSSWVTAPFTARIVVSANSPVNRDVLAWLAAHGVTKHARKLALWDKPSDRFVDDIWEETSTSEQDADNQRCASASLNYIPDFGKYHFRYQGQFMSMERKDFEYTEPSPGGVKHEGLDPSIPRQLVLECFPTLRGTSPLKRFLEHVKGFSTPSKENTTTLYHAIGNLDGWRGNSVAINWTVGACRPARSLDSVALERVKKVAMVKDIAYYLTPECQRFYANRGYPYRRGFLLYGPPGTGKTSFCVALAGHFNLDVYILSMSDQSMSDQQLELLFVNLPDKCIVLLEDVDSAGLNREAGTAERRQRKRKTKHNPSDYSSLLNLAEEHNTGITLSGLLNCIDGPMSRDGHIICLTTNAPDSLDPALVRPGRCDHKVLFGYASEEISTQLFEHLYIKRPDELVAGETSVSDDHDIPSMAQAFAKAIPPDSMISPAEVQGYLMIHRQDPQAALDGVSAFAAEIIETKKRGANVAKHANEVDRAGRDTWDVVNQGVAKEDCASDEDQSGEGDDCGCCDVGWDCECAAASSNVGVCRRCIDQEAQVFVRGRVEQGISKPGSRAYASGGLMYLITTRQWVTMREIEQKHDLRSSL